MESKSICFKEVKKAFEAYLLNLGYSKATTEMYRWTFSRLEKFMSERGETVYSAETGIALLSKVLKGEHSNRYLNDTRLIIRRLDDFLNERFTVLLPKGNSISDCYLKYFNNYLESLRFRGLRESSIKELYYSCIKIFRISYSLQIYDFSKIQPQNIYDIFTRSSDKANTSRTLRSFLRYLFKSGIHVNDFSVFVPSVRKRKPIPSVYTKEETNKILSSIDITQNSGKRNLAVILLALRLGIRSCDIVNLKISDIDFNTNTIEFIQSKTMVHQRLEFLPELKDAISLYLSEGRPKTEYTNIFISTRPPFRPITVMAVTSLIIRYMKGSGISIGSRKCGGHALRMTLASELVSEKVPYEVVRKILGHEDTKSMKHYVKFDVDMLRTCALEVPSLTGLCADFINDRKGGRKK